MKLTLTILLMLSVAVCEGQATDTTGCKCKMSVSKSDTLGTTKLKCHEIIIEHGADTLGWFRGTTNFKPMTVKGMSLRDEGVTGSTQATPTIWVNSPYAIHYDTVKCWLWEAKEVGDLTIVTEWVKGYKINPVGTYFSFNGESPQVEYLYDDRKTKVTNQVILSIERP